MLLSSQPALAGPAHVLRFTEGIDVTTLNPFLATSGNVADLSGLTMAYLVRYDAGRHPVPELIVEIPTQRNGGVSADGLTVTYRLRHGVRWSDGASFDADDVAYTLRAVADSSNLITNRDAYDRIRSFDEPDKFTIVVHLRAPFAPFIARWFASGNLDCILPAHILGNSTNFNQAPYNALPVGIGPFRYTAFRRGDAIEMEANPFYFGAKPKLQKIVYKLITDDNTIFAQLQTGELDLWAAVSGNFVDRVRTLPGVEMETTPTTYVSGIFLQTERPALRDPAVRRALRLALNRPYLFEIVAHKLGVLEESVVAPSTLDYADIPRVPYDPAAANNVLDAAGWSRGADGVRAKGGIRLALTVALPAGYAPSAQTAELVRVAWTQIGADVTTKPASSALFFAPANAGGVIQSGNFDAALLSQTTGVFADLTPVYGCAYRSPAGLNGTRYCNPAVDREMNRYVETYDPRARAAIARAFQEQIDRDAPLIVIYARSFAYVHTSRLTNLRPQTFGVFDAISGADIAGN